ncbi:MAG: DUF4124 domain-containing protein [Thiolinea sp.]
MKYSVAAVLGLLIISTTASAAFRWVDDDGKVHYSDSVPPSKAQKGHTELDELGNKVNKVAPAKSKEELEEEAWMNELEKKLRLKKSQQKRKDALLLNSYASLEQFDEFYAERFEVLSDERKQLELLSSKLERELERLLKQHKASTNAVAKKRVQGFIDINVENTQAYQDAIKQNISEEKNIREEAKKLRKRFLYLQQKKAQAEAEKKP